MLGQSVLRILGPSVVCLYLHPDCSLHFRREWVRIFDQGAVRIFGRVVHIFGQGVVKLHFLATALLVLSAQTWQIVSAKCCS